LARKLKMSAVVSVLTTIILSITYKWTANNVCLSIAITFGTISYHLVMRFLVGLILNAAMDNKADYTKPHYSVSKYEMQLYAKMKVKKWKGKLPSYDGSLFDPRKHSWDEIAQAICQAEIVHETIVILSFLPIIAGVWFGDFPVFIITSLLAAAVDLTFVIMQRYNRQRVLRLIEKK
jgi:hypothetical protein